ncbi:MAG: signal peptidase II [Lachnospiraceae bacterium]|nr:signal peptidase II [Lachnospiraceae bacterium]
MENANKQGRRGFGILMILILTAIDLITKRIAAGSLVSGPFVVIPGVFELRYLENRGAAFSMLQNQRWFFILITIVFIAAALWLYFRIPLTKRMRLLRWIMIAVTAGAVGNLVDRVHLGYVRDFLYFSLIDFPIFNVADIYVTVSAVLFATAVLFIYKDQDLDFLKIK